MASTVTPSSSLPSLKQGVSIRTLNSYLAGAIRMIGSGRKTRFVLSGTSTTPTFFDETSCTVGIGRLSNSPQVLIINHNLEPNDFGQREFIFTPIFNDVYHDTIADTVGLITTPDAKEQTPLQLRYKSLVHKDQLNGIIEPLTIRPLIDHTATPPEKALVPHANVGLMTSLGKTEIASQFIDVLQSSIHPYVDDRTNTNPKLCVIPTGSFDAQLQPFDDTKSKKQMIYTEVYSAQGFSFNFGDPEIEGVLLSMTASQNTFAPRNSRSATAGFVYTLSNLTGAFIGTDSIAFGGLKK